MKETQPMDAMWRKWRAWVAVGVLLIACEPAHAFYWQGWPGSRIHIEPTLVGPSPLPQPGNPDTPDTEIPPIPTGPSIPVDRPPIGPPTQTPEPATGLLGLLGLGALAARRWWK